MAARAEGARTQLGIGTWMFHVSLEGIAYFLLQPGAGEAALRKAIYFGLGFGLMLGVFATLGNLWPRWTNDSDLAFIPLVGTQVLLFIFYLMLLLLPHRCVQSRCVRAQRRRRASHLTSSHPPAPRCGSMPRAGSRFASPSD